MNSLQRQKFLSQLPFVIAGAIFAGFYFIWLENQSPVQGAKLVLILIYLWVFFSLAASFIWKRVLAPKLGNFSARWKNGWMVFCFLAGFWLTDNIPIIVPGSGIMKAMLFFCAALSIAVLLFILSTLVITRFRPPNPPVNRRLGWLVFALPMLAVWTIYLLAFWPGMMSADSLNQWGQVLSGNFTNHHPAFHTFTIWLLTRITLSPAIVAFAQIIGLALAAGFTLAEIEKMGAASKWVWAASVVFALSPVNGTMTSTLWKDIPFSITLLLFTTLIFKLAKSKGAWISKGFQWVWLGIAAAASALFRHNGLQVVVGSLIVLIAAFRKQRLPLVLGLALTISLFYTITGPLYNWIGVEKSTALVNFAVSPYTIAAEADAGSKVDQTFDALHPLSSNWNCPAILPTLTEAKISDGVGYSENTFEKIQNLIEYSPDLMAYNYRCNRSLVWIIWDPNGEVRNPSHAEYWIDPNNYGIQPASLIPALQQAISTFVGSTAHNPDINWLLWRPALYLYLFLFVTIIAAIRQRNPWIILIAVPVLIQSVGSTLVSFPPNFRYHYYTYIIALIFWPILFAPSLSAASSDEEPLPTINNHAES